MNICISTLSLTLSINYLVFGLIYLFIYKKFSSLVEGVQYWMVAVWLFSCTYFLVFLREGSDNNLLIIAPNLIGLVALLFVLKGIFTFCEREMNAFTGYLFLYTSAAAGMIYFYDVYMIRRVIISTAVSITLLHSALIFYESLSENRHFSYRFAGIVIFLMGLLYLTRAGTAILTLTFDSPENPFEKVILLLHTVLSYIFFFSLILIIYDKFYSKLQTQKKTIGILKELIPICSRCNKIRDDSGYQHQLEKYIQLHTGSSFSHGICPDCAADLYPEYKDQLSQAINTANKKASEGDSSEG